MRTFEKTHPWIRFSLNLVDAPPVLWLMLGESQSKCDHLASAPLGPSTAQELHRIYLAKGAQATTAIEGNTLTEEQVLRLIQGSLELAPSKEYLRKEVDNMIHAYNEALRLVEAGSSLQLSVERIKRLNACVLEGLNVEDSVAPGQLRTYSVVVGNVYRGAPAEDCEHLLERLCAWLNGPDFMPPESMKGYTAVYAILRAVLAHLYLAWIHPFGDGNGRTARLVEYEILIASGLSSNVAHLLSSHYNATRTEYYRQLDLASKPNGGAIPFLQYAVQGLLDGLREYVERIWRQQYDVVWRSYVHEKFREWSGKVHDRRRWLVLDLSTSDASVTKEQIMGLTPRLARLYARSSEKTLSRDLSDVVNMGLVVKESTRYRARKEAILSFLPVRAPSV